MVGRAFLPLQLVPLEMGILITAYLTGLQPGGVMGTAFVVDVVSDMGLRVCKKFSEPLYKKIFYG